ncbi:BtpA/SgcQ family protein [Treponema sp. OMZ 840]|uniref:BtpA/SgcQ family protein n=1 Tax=Treponema sp. OMZ 840 TaxID=244313 RepID=UPI003D8D5AB9
MKFNDIFTVRKPIIGMVHVHPLPGSSLYDKNAMDIKKITSVAVEEAKKLEAAGVDGLQVENIWDFPYQKAETLSPATIAALAVVTSHVIENVSIPVGVNCHFNAAEAALVVAIASGAKWIRIFEYCGAFISQVGFIDSIGASVSRMRSYLDAKEILFLCDVNVKLGSHFIINDRSVAEQAQDIEQEGGDSVIVTGFKTGMAPSVEKIQEVKTAVSIPVLLGSGVTIKNVKDLLSVADGAIIGSWFKEGNDWKNSVSYQRVFDFMNVIRGLRKEIR